MHSLAAAHAELEPLLASSPTTPGGSTTTCTEAPGIKLASACVTASLSSSGASFPENVSDRMETHPMAAEKAQTAWNLTGMNLKLMSWSGAGGEGR